MAGCLLLSALLVASRAYGQDVWPEYPQVDPNDPHTILRGPGGYFAWWKLLAIALVFVGWVKLTDWMNKDAIRFKNQHGLAPEIWNPIAIVAFLAGLLGAVINIPWFLLGFGVYVLLAVAPILVYGWMRRGKVQSDRVEEGDLQVPDYEDLQVQFKAAGSSPEQRQSNLIRARQSPVFVQTAEQLYDYALRRVEMLMLDFTKDGVNVKIQVDGAWIDQPPLDRPTGDAMLASLKYLANLNPRERRNRQAGRFDTRIRRLEITNHLTTQGTPQGERALLKFEFDTEQSSDLRVLGMWEDQYSKLMDCLDQPGYIVISAPPGQGLSSSWKSLLHSVDRFVNDWVALIDVNEQETSVENIEPTRFDARQGESPFPRLRKMLLKEPVGLVVPNPIDAQTLDQLTREVTDNQRRVLSRIQAKSAVEAMLRMMALSKDHRPRYIEAITVSICQRLVRRLCDNCKQPMPVGVRILQQMGGDPASPPTIFTHFQPPPPDQRIDERGKPISIPVCQTCSGIGYIGRIAVYEVLFVDDSVRAAMLKKPTVEAVSQAAVQAGHPGLVRQAYRLVLEGITSIQEVQRVMRS